MKPVILPAALVRDFSYHNKLSMHDHYSGQYKRLSDAIAEEEGRATARTITPDEIVFSLQKIESTLRIPKKSLEGVSVWVDPNAQKFPNAYQFTPMSTSFKATFKNGTWRVVDICRVKCTLPEVYVTHTDASREALIKRFTRF